MGCALRQWTVRGETLLHWTGDRKCPMPSDEWRTLMDIPPEISDVHDNQGRTWEREGADWVTYGSYTQRWSTAVTDLSGWGPFRPGRVDAWGGKTA